MRRRIAVLGVLALGCREPEGDDSDTAVDTGHETLTIPEMPLSIEVPATEASLQTSYAVDVTGTGTDDVGAIAITDNVGTMTLDGTSLPTVAFIQIPWPQFSQTLYQGFAVGPGRWDVYWLYCSGAEADEGPLATLWVEGIGAAPLHPAAASGTCTAELTPTLAELSLPAVSVDLPDPPTGFAIAGDDLVLEDGGTGALWLEDRAVPFTVFEVVDCTVGCGDPGWTELHSVVWADPDAIFVILYLIEGDSEHVQLTYARALPSFDDPIGTITLPAAWTAAPPVTVRRGPPAAFVPPPG